MKVKHCGKFFFVALLTATLFAPYVALANVEKLATQTGEHLKIPIRFFTCIGDVHAKFERVS